MSVDLKEKIKEIKEKQSYVSLHTHSEYSLLDGSIKIEELIKNTPYTVALTDHGNLHGALKFYKGMKKAGKHPIIGIEAYASSIKGDLERYHLILLCKNKLGYKNLLKLVAKSYDNFYYKPHIMFEDLKKYHEGLIVLSACLGGEVAQNILNGDTKKVREVISAYKEIFQDDYYLEIQNHKKTEDLLVNNNIIELANEFDIKVVATNDSHFLNKSDKDLHDLILCISTKKTIKDEDRMTLEGENYHLLTNEEMNNLWGENSEYLENTLEVAAKCLDFELNLNNLYMPNVEVPEGFKDEYEYIRSLIWEGMKKKGIDKDTEAIERVKHELQIIKNMGFIGYFLIVYDYVNWAKNNGIVVGPGRGSAAGSLVCYALNITEINPLNHELIFERFLNPDRISMPDIDTDFSDPEKVLAYAKKKYGEGHVSQIVTIGTIGLKNGIRDTTRVLNLPYGVGDRLSKLIENGTKPSDLESNLDMKEAIKDKTNKKIVDYAKRLYGLPRNTGTHACFRKGTPITTDNGLVPIDSIKVGDMVKTHNNRFKEVVDVIITKTKEIYELIYETIDDEYTVFVTGNHPVFTVGRIEPAREFSWTKVNKLKKKSLLYTIDEKGIYKVAKIKKLKKHKLKEEETVYNLTVLDESSYLANTLIVHNCGVILSSKEIADVIPIMKIKDKDSNGKNITRTLTQFEMSECEEVGLLKMDFLGLKTLKIMEDTLKLVGLQNIPESEMYNVKNYDIIRKGDTDGLFQIESSGMKKLMKELYQDYNKIKNKDNAGEIMFERLTAGVSLYRPGPMSYIPDYINGMLKPKTIKYDHPLLKPILENTYGIIAYQEQVMMIARSLSGFTMAEADTLRKAMGKKKKDVMDSMKIKFIEGAKKNNVNEETAILIWEKCEKFSEYAFNKSHGACYAVNAINTAYLKTNYPVEFMTSILNSKLDSPEELKDAVTMVRKMGIKILPPNVNKSNYDFTPLNGSILFGLGGIKRLKETAKRIIKMREKGGEYVNIDDLLKRAKVSESDAIILAQVGALEDFGKRKEIIEKLPSIIKILGKSYNVEGQHVMEPFLNEFKEEDDFDPFTKYEYEMEGCQMYFGEHPSKKEIERMKKSKLKNITDISNIEYDKIYFIAGIVKDYNKRKIKEDMSMITFTLEDSSGDVKCVKFLNELGDEMENIKFTGISNKDLLVLKGKYQNSDFGEQFMAYDILVNKSIRGK